MKNVTFQEFDTDDEKLAVVNRVIDNLNLVEGKVLQLIAEKTAKKPSRKTKKGFINMKTLLIVFAMAIVMLFATNVCAYVATDINYDIASNPETLQQYLRDAIASGTFTFTPMAAPAGNDIIEGKMYYDSSSNAWFGSTNGTTWTQFEIGSSTVSLDAAYNNGITITVDAGAVALTATNAADNIVLAIVQADTGSVVAQTITSAGTGALLSFDSNGTGADILGSDSAWTITKAGLATLNGGLTISTADVLFDATSAGKDVNWDDSEETMCFLDNAVLGFGNTAAAPDVEITWNASNLLIESKTEDTGEIRIGSTNAIDLALYGNTNTEIALFNANTSTLEFNGYDAQFQDADILAFGDSDDVTIAYDGAVGDDLDILFDDKEISFGADGAGGNIVIHSEAASSNVTFTEQTDDVLFVAYDIDLDDNSNLIVGSDDEWTIDNATETLRIIPSDTTDDFDFHIGSVANTTDIAIFGENASTIIYDSSADRVTYDVYDVEYNDTSDLIIGSDDEFTIDNSSETLRIIPSDTDDDFAMHLGSANNTMDVLIYGKTASELFTWDAGADSLTIVGDLALFTVTGTTLPFHVNATGTWAAD